MSEKFYAEMRVLLEAEEVGPDTDLPSLRWDSVAVMETMALLDELFGKIVDGKKLSECKTPAEILKLV
jgi:acyl carrier protein